MGMGASSHGSDNNVTEKNDQAAKKSPPKPALKSLAVSRRWKAAAAAVTAANSLASQKNNSASDDREVDVGNGDSQASLNIDEELAIMDAAEGIPRTAGGDSFEVGSFDDDDDMSLSDLSTASVAEDGCMRIIDHRKVCNFLLLPRFIFIPFRSNKK